MNDLHDQTNDPAPVLALRRDQAAQSLGISPRALEELAHRGEVPCVRLGRRLVVYPVDLLREWLRERATLPTPNESGGESA